MCASVVRANPDSRAFVELEGCQFKHMFVTCGASLNGFILICQKMLVVDGVHLNGPYEGTLLGAVALNANNHLFDEIGWVEAYSYVRQEPSLQYVVAKVFGVQNHTYYVRHLRENFITVAGKYG